MSEGDGMRHWLVWSSDADEPSIAQWPALADMMRAMGLRVEGPFVLERIGPVEVDLTEEP